jgi:predicted esterase YcpF (UPF0227 family)
MTTFVYLHGFNSAFSPENDKVKSLSSLGTVIGVSYDSYGTYDNIRSYLINEILQYDLDELVIVGTSLGGFWAAELGSALSLPSVIINPCYDPTNMLQKYVGPQKNYLTLQETSFELLSALSYANRKTYELDFSYLPLVLLDMGDEVIDSFETLRLFKGFPTVHWLTGSHRFDHMKDALEDISLYSNRCSFVSQDNF